jgi:hypothetical protein
MRCSGHDARCDRVVAQEPSASDGVLRSSRPGAWRFGRLWASRATASEISAPSFSALSLSAEVIPATRYSWGCGAPCGVPPGDGGGNPMRETDPK